VDSKLEESFEKSAHNFIQFLASRGITIQDLYASFEKSDIERGLFLLNKPETSIEIIRHSPNRMLIKHGELIELFVYAESFPKPIYAFYKDEKLLSTDNSYRINEAK
jgi:hypothetical protein